jgi:hypothetical protein
VEAEGGLGGESMSQTKSVRVKGRRERAVKTEVKARTKTIKEAPEEKAQMRYEDKRRIGRALNVYRKLVEKFGLAPGDWAAIDFHPKKRAVVFVPPNVLRAVEQEELARFLTEMGVKKALVDSLVPKYSDVLVELDKSGFEVYYLSWPEVLDDFKAFVKRIMKEQKKRFRIEIRKDDYTDAVLLAFISPKYHRKFDRCWAEMMDWRDSDSSLSYALRRLSSRSKTRQQRFKEEVKLLRKMRNEDAKRFVEVAKSHHPVLEEIIEEYGLKKPHQQAYCAEVIIETLPCKTFVHVLHKCGFPTKGKAKLTFYDRRLAHAVTQLTYAAYHIKAFSKKQKTVKTRARELLYKLWERLHQQPGDGRVGEALDRVTDLMSYDNLYLRAERPGVRTHISTNPALVQGPRHPAVLTTTPTTSNPPLFPF